MSVDPEQEPTAEAQDSLDPQTQDSAPDEGLGDAGTSKGSNFTDPLPGL